MSGVAHTVPASEGSRQLLLVTPFWPPCGGPGVQRALKFVKYLAGFGWRCTVLTAAEALLGTDETLCREVPAGTEAIRLSAPRRAQVAAGARRLAWPARPIGRRLGKGDDWIPSAVEWRVWKLATELIVPDWTALWAYRCIPAAFRLARRENFDAVLTTGPPHSTHLLGWCLKRLRGLPWVADFRDPWVKNMLNGPERKLGYRMDRLLEPAVLKSASAVLAVTAGEVRQLRTSLPEPMRRKVRLIRNGFDPEDLRLANLPAEPVVSRFHLHYNGALYGPQHARWFFEGLRRFLDGTGRRNLPLRVTFTGLGEREQQDIRRWNLQSIIEDVGVLDHLASLRIAARSSALLLLLGDGPNMRNVIPAKAYEYLALRRPVLAMLPRGGELESILSNWPGAFVAGFSDPAGIAEQLDPLYRRWLREPALPVPPHPDLASFNRQSQACKLAELLDRLVSQRNHEQVRA